MSQLSGWVVLQHLLLLLLLLLRLQRLFRYLLGFRHRQTVSLQTLSCPKKKRCSLFGVDARGSPTQSEEQYTARWLKMHIPTYTDTYIHTHSGGRCRLSASCHGFAMPYTHKWGLHPSYACSHEATRDRYIVADTPIHTHTHTHRRGTIVL